MFYWELCFLDHKSQGKQILCAASLQICFTESFVYRIQKKAFSKKYVHGFDSKKNVLVVAVFQSFYKKGIRKDLEVGSYSIKLPQEMADSQSSCTKSECCNVLCSLTYESRYFTIILQHLLQI